MSSVFRVGAEHVLTKRSPPVSSHAGDRNHGNHHYDYRHFETGSGGARQRASDSSIERKYLRITAAIAEFERVLAQGEMPSLFRGRQVCSFSRRFGGRFAVAA